MAGRLTSSRKSREGTGQIAKTGRKRSDGGRGALPTPSSPPPTNHQRRVGGKPPRTGGKLITHNKKKPTPFQRIEPTSNSHKTPRTLEHTREREVDSRLAGTKAHPDNTPRKNLSTRVQNDQHVRNGIHDRSLALNRCPICNNLEESERPDTAGGDNPINCANCGTLDNGHGETARRRQRKVIQAIFIPDHITDIKATPTPTPTTRHNPQRIGSTKVASQAPSKHAEHRPPCPNTNKYSTYMESKEDNDLTLKDVPNYVPDTDDGGENQDGSLRNLIMSLRADFQMVGRKVDAVQKNLGATQNKVEELVVQMNDAAEEQVKFREETRATAKKTTSAIKKVQEAQRNLEAKQEQALQQLRQQVLKELDDKTGRVNNQQDHPIPPSRRNAPNSEWLRRATERPQTHEKRICDEPIPQRYSEIFQKEMSTRPKSANKNGALALVYVRDWKNESIGIIKRALRSELDQIPDEPTNQNNNDEDQGNEKWPDIDAVRHINVYGTPTSPLMEIACTPAIEAKLRAFFAQKDVEVGDCELNRCIDPAIQETTKTDNKKIALRLKNHFVRLLLA